MTAMKTCSKCHKDLPIRAFYYSRVRGVHMSSCKTCCKNYMNAYNKKKSEEAKKLKIQTLQNAIGPHNKAVPVVPTTPVGTRTIQVSQLVASIVSKVMADLIDKGYIR